MTLRSVRGFTVHLIPQLSGTSLIGNDLAHAFSVVTSMKVNADRMLEAVADKSLKRPVLVVDDDVLVRSMIADIFRDEELVVIECGDADEAMEVLASGAAIALLFSDIRMPGSMDGVGLAKAVRTQFPSLKIALTSADLLPRGAFCDAFFSKPWDVSHVIRGVRSLLTV